MKAELKKQLQMLAVKYENTNFLKEDPSQFLRWYTSQKDVELASFITALLSFGNRKQFIPKVREILEMSDKKGGISEWIRTGAFEDDFISPTGKDDRKFYRFYSYEDMKKLFRRLNAVLEADETLGKCMEKKYMAYQKKAAEMTERASQAEVMSLFFASVFADCDIVPKGKSSACKRIHMFLRWMVRNNSPVDLGLWTWLDKKELLIPLDTHVMKESEKMGLIPEHSSADLHTARLLTEVLKEVWPEDPCKGDFALFGLGVD